MAGIRTNLDDPLETGMNETIRRPQIKRRLYFAVAAVIALLCASIAFGVSSKAARDPSQSDSLGPHPVSDVPSSIPPDGVQVGTLVLMPATEADNQLASETEGIKAAETYANTGLEPEAVLARVTIPGTIPPKDTDIKWRQPIQDQLAWVVTFPFSEPQEVGDTLNESGTGFTARFYSVVVDASTGAFVWGFYTK
jgi:hypothetical protein